MADVNDVLDVHTDNLGRIIDKQGRPLRDRRSRNHGPVPFRGKPGKPHANTARLEARQASYEADKKTQGRKKPGSLRK